MKTQQQRPPKARKLLLLLLLIGFVVPTFVTWILSTIVNRSRYNIEEKNRIADEQAQRTFWENQLRAEDAALAAITSEELDENASWPRTFIWSINTGRSGSRFLANLIGSSENVYSYHEPSFCHVLRDTGKWQNSYDRRRREILPSLWRTVEKMPKGAVYSNTCPNFKSQLHDVVMDALLALHGRRDSLIKVVILRRYLPSIVQSLANIGWSADSNPLSCLWCRTSNWANSFIKAPKSDKTMSQIERLISYVVSTEAFGQWFKLRFADNPRVEIIEVRLEEIATNETAAKLLLEHLGLSIVESQFKMAFETGQLSDKLCNAQKTFKHVTTLPKVEQEAKKYISLCKHQNIELPTTLNDIMTPWKDFDYNSNKKCSKTQDDADAVQIQSRRFIKDTYG